MSPLAAPAGAAPVGAGASVVAAAAGSAAAVVSPSPPRLRPLFLYVIYYLNIKL